MLAQFQSESRALQSGEWLKTNNPLGPMSVDVPRFSKYVAANLELYQDAWSTLEDMGIKVWLTRISVLSLAYGLKS